MTAIATRLPRQYFLSNLTNCGTSDTANRLREFWNISVETLKTADTWNRNRDAFSQLDEVYRSCAKPNWDGYGALPITAIAYQEASSILSTIPAI